MRTRAQQIPLLGIALILLAGAHAVFAWRVRDIRPEFSIVDPPPSVLAREAFALGDKQFLYRTWALDLQNAGDTGGRATAMRNYNYDNVIGWLKTLQALDPLSEYYTFMAMHYFALTPVISDVRAIGDFVVEDVRVAPAIKWPWMMQVVALTQRRLQDLEYALEVSKELASYDYPEIPGWVFMFPATILEKMKRYSEARIFLEKVLAERAHRLSADDLLWAEQFLQQLPLTIQ